MPGFSIEVADQGTVCVIAVSGDLDIEHAGDLAAVGRLVIESHRAVRVVIDLGNVGFIDSTGLRALVEIRNAATSARRTVELRDVHVRVQKVIEITGLAEVFSLAPNEPEHV
jgi:anti-sigma B factor antagonist